MDCWLYGVCCKLIKHECRHLHAALCSPRVLACTLKWHKHRQGCTVTESLLPLQGCRAPGYRLCQSSARLEVQVQAWPPVERQPAPPCHLTTHFWHTGTTSASSDSTTGFSSVPHRAGEMKTLYGGRSILIYTSHGVILLRMAGGPQSLFTSSWRHRPGQ